MSRYRDDRDDDFYVEHARARRADYEDDRGRYGGGDEDRRGDFYDEYVRRRTGGDTSGRRDDYRDERERRGDAYGAGRRYEGRYDEDERTRRYEDDERARRSFYEEGRDYFRERRGGFGGGRGATRRGATRSHVRCRDIMTRDVTVATRDTTLEEVARLMKNEDTGVIPVVDRAEANAFDAASDAGTATGANASAGASAETRRASSTIHGNGRLVGLITDRDIVVRAIAEGRAAATTRAEEIMTEEVHTAHPNDRVIEAIRKMGDKQVRRIPIVDQDRTLRGIISMADVALETNDDRELAEALEEISSGSSFWNRIFG
ncbi:MAG TPA: CBS domain-containing protein [Pyrinomonadaceae bacterium]|nr:CBS domain-containing protein [Pyrinomonadaceae bacterium]